MTTLAVCSWSLQPDSPAELVHLLEACALDAVQLALDPLSSGQWDEAETVERLKSSGIRIISGMMTTAGEDYSSLESIRRTGGIRPDSTWQQNIEAAHRNAALAARLGLDLVTFHAGFIPHNRADPEYRTLIDRLSAIVNAFETQGVRVGLETGQETAETLLDALDALDRPGVGINFDPANMILYSMGDPVEALDQLAPRVLQIHIKDALPAARAGAWGSEVPVGQGSVDWDRFLDIVRDRLPDRNLVIEREAGNQRVRDVVTAAAHLREHAPWVHA
ncbi:MAG: sugar phosphate isomerase/epimerase family protein [Phycisphaerales bacterium]